VEREELAQALGESVDSALAESESVN